MSFHLKTLLGITLIQAVVLLILVVSSQEYLRANQHELQRHATATARLLATAAADAVLTTDEARLQQLVNTFMENADIVRLRISDLDRDLVTAGSQSALQRPFRTDVKLLDAVDGIYDISAPVFVADQVIGRVELGLSVSSIQTFIGDANWCIVSLVILQMSLLVWLTWLLGRYRNRQLADLEYASRQVADDKFITPIVVSGIDEFGGVSATVNDMADRINNSHEALSGSLDESHRSGEWTEAVVSSVSDGLITIDTAGRVTLFNAAAERIFGYTAQEVLGRNVNMLMPEPFRSRHDHYLKNYLQTGVKQIIGIGREVKGVRKDASLFPMSLSITELRVGNDKKFIGLVRDITESKLLNEKLLINQNMKQAILRSSLDGIITIDSQGLICEFSPSAEKMFGYDAKAIHGKPMYQLLIPDRFRELHLRGLAHYVKTGEHKILGQRIEIIALNSVGQEFPVELTVTPQFSDEGMFFTAFIRDISEAKRAQEALRQALKQAEQASLLKSQFLSTMSHEIRTPLNIILGAQELLFDMAVEDTQKYYLKLANDAGNTLFALINDILDLSKVEAGKLELENHVFDPLKLINEVLQLISIKAEEKKLALHCEIAPQVATIINGDSRRLRQVLLNLLTNAVKFTQVGEIILRLTPSQADPDKGVLLFEIIDTGIGIDEEIQKRLFQHFLQADPSDTRKYGGSGLGLAISRRLVELWGGKIGLESQVGKGCRFWFSFGQAVDNTQVDIAVESKELQQSVSRSISTVLLVEDSPANQAVLSGILRTAHHEVDVVDNGIAAIAAVQAKAYDLIFMDVSMPNMDGMEATRHIRALGGAAANVPIVAMTAHAIKGYQVRCLEAGMSDYATKPISKKHLLKLVERWNDTDIKNVTHAVEQSVPAIELDLFDDKVMHDLSVDTGIEDISLLIRIFVDELTKCQILLMEAIEKQALDELAHLAHTLKSSTGHFGARRLQSLAIEVNDHCQKGDLVMALHFARRLLPCLEVTLKDLKVRIV